MSTTQNALAVNPAVDAILRRDEGRKPELVRLKYRRMGEDVFAFFRGTDHLFASAWPDLVPIDPGPSILICGDLHLENFGAYRAEDGDFVFDINDFDEALVGPCSLDVVRCSTSILLAAQVWGLSPIQAMRTVLGYLERYRATIAEDAGGPRRGRISLADRSGPVDRLIGDCSLGTQATLLDRLTRLDRSGTRSIRRSVDKLPAIGKGRTSAIVEAIETYGRSVGRPDAYKVLDVSGRIAGVGSLGVKRYVALVEGDGSPDGNRLLDIKAAAPSALRGCTMDIQPRSWTGQARRVVEAQRQLQAKPTAGLGVLMIKGEEFRVRELIPDENRARLDRFRRKPSKLRQAVEVAGRITAWSQLRGARLDDGLDRTADLAGWAASPALDAVLASSVRFADRTRADFKAFKKARLDLEV
jgi:uncharacterized protein (DUF2252 family)